MKVTTGVVQKLVITDVPSLDAVAVYLEDQGKGRGKMVVTCFNESWSYFWGGMGEGLIKDFILGCDIPYLAGKLGNGLAQWIDEPEKIYEEAKKDICERRRTDELTKEKARDLFDSAEVLRDVEGPVLSENCQHIMYEIFGCEWYDCIPQKPNPKYEYLCRIIGVIKEALKEMK